MGGWVQEKGLVNVFLFENESSHEFAVCNGLLGVGIFLIALALLTDILEVRYRIFSTAAYFSLGPGVLIYGVGAFLYLRSWLSGWFSCLLAG